MKSITLYKYEIVSQVISNIDYFTFLKTATMRKVHAERLVT